MNHHLLTSAQMNRTSAQSLVSYTQHYRTLAETIDNDAESKSKTPATSISARSPRREPSLKNAAEDQRDESREPQDGVPLEDIDSLHEQEQAP